MADFEEVLLYHFKNYPLMTPQDAVKLCYQSAFGCGHLVKSEEYAMSMLKKELDYIEPYTGAQLFEPIGSGYSRLDLHKAKAMMIPVEIICEIFIKSANCGNKTEIEPKIEILQKLAKEGKTPFSENELSEYLNGYNGEMVSHSEKYKEAYFPAYRVIFEEFAKDLQ